MRACHRKNGWTNDLKAALENIKCDCQRGERDEGRVGERVGAFFAAALRLFLLGRLRRYQAIEAAVVAKAMVRLSIQSSRCGTIVLESDAIQALGE